MPQPELTPEQTTSAEAVFVEHQAFIASVARRYAPSNELIPDIVQQVAMAVCRSYHKFRGGSSVRTWLYTITRRESVSMFRRENRYEMQVAAAQVQPVDPTKEIHPNDGVRRIELRAALQDALRQLKPTRRQDFCNTRVRADVSSSRTAAERSRHMRARQEMREILIADTRIDERWRTNTDGSRRNRAGACSRRSDP